MNDKKTKNESAINEIMVEGIEVVNLTPHFVNLQTATQGLVSIPPASDKPARVIQDRNTVKTPLPIMGYLLRGNTIVGLPAQKGDNVLYIVSPMVRMMLTNQGDERKDVFSPYGVTTTQGREGGLVKCATALAR